MGISVYPIVAGGLLAVKSHAPASVITTSSTTLSDIDAANLIITFTAPASGKVLVKFTGSVFQSSNAGWQVWGIREGAVTVNTERVTSTLDGNRPTAVWVISGLTPGQQYTYKWAWRVENATVTATFATSQDAVMEVWEA